MTNQFGCEVLQLSQEFPQPPAHYYIIILCLAAALAESPYVQMKGKVDSELNQVE
jgi:hypothetical protein